MAFKDENGKITIDEVAAQRDINNLKQIKLQLEEAQDLVKQINILSTDMKGNTATVVNAVSVCLLKEIAELLAHITNTQDDITKIVNKYQAIDQKLKEIIQM